MAFNGKIFTASLRDQFADLQTEFEAWRQDTHYNADELPYLFLCQFRQLVADCCPQTIFEFMARTTVSTTEMYALIKGALAFAAIRRADHDRQRPFQEPEQGDTPY